MNTIAQQLADRLSGLVEVKADEPLASHTSFRIGGPADAYVKARTRQELIAAVLAARDLDIPHLLFGGGSNLLILDSGIVGLAIEVRTRRISGLPASLGLGAVQVIAEAGAPLAALGRNAARIGYRGLEWAVDVPGTVGGAVINNAGANGGCIADSLVSVEVLELDGALRAWPASRLAFDYRRSALKVLDPLAPRPVVISATFSLDPGDPVSLANSVAAYSRYRRATQPVGASAGSMFKNRPEAAAGKLIDEAGLKGSQINQMRISDLHGNFFLNLGGATARDVLALVERARAVVEANTGSELELEIQVVGNRRSNV